jgi:3-methyl-2-oxobutanoate hydroxymethyltransferase
MLGITRQFKPRYLRTYGTFGEDIANAIRHYISDVKNCDFPNEKEQY